MKKNKKIIIIISVIFFLILFSVIGFLVYKNYNSNAFSLKENEWIDNNKNKLIDIYLLNEVPLLNYNGQGITFDFLDSIEEDLGIKFNRNAFKLDDNIDESYTFKLVNKAGEDDILIFRDNYVLITNTNNIYSKSSEINNLNIGVLSSDEFLIKSYYSDIDISNKNITFVVFESYTDLMKEIFKEDSRINALFILKSLYTDYLISSDNLSIGYQYANLTKDFVISIKDNDTLKSIINKSYNNWSKDNFEDKYNEYLISQYFKVKNISDIEQKNLRSKKFEYGFIENGIYDELNGSKLKGINSLILKDFSDFSGVSIEYKKYGTMDELISNFNGGNVDIFFDQSFKQQYSIETYKTNSLLDAQYAVISNINNPITINSLMDIKDKEVSIIKSTYIESYMNNNSIKYKSYENMEDLIDNINNNSIIIVDLNNFEYYKNSSFVNFKIDYIYDTLDDYGYVINNNRENKVFSGLFDFYISYVSPISIINNNYTSLVEEKISYYPLLIVIIIVLSLIIIFMLISRLKKFIINYKKSRKDKLSKEDKLKYIDQLTSLKNRAYLNSKIESWDDSEVYPQAIIILDLNNIAYINDNYGREEGDKVITQAANILIMTQLPNTEIIRTDGNEFLVYLVGYDEKHIISYLRKLNREFKNLSHGFGAASGYSIIKNGIKTIDDAVNEATLDMKNNKEDINY